MFEKENLKLSDFVTPPIPRGEYIASVKPMIFQKKYSENYRSYAPDKEILSKIKNWLNQNDENLKIIAVGAKWCPDCTRNIGQLIKIVEEMDDPRCICSIIGGIKIKLKYLRKEGEPKWKSPPSPPETVDPHFDISKIPIIYFFNKEGNCLGKIVENPEHTETLEGEILHYLAS